MTAAAGRWIVGRLCGLVPRKHSRISVERGVANEVDALVTFLNSRYAQDDFNRIRFAEVQRIAAGAQYAGDAHPYQLRSGEDDLDGADELVSGRRERG